MRIVCTFLDPESSRRKPGLWLTTGLEFLLRGDVRGSFSKHFERYDCLNPIFPIVNDAKDLCAESYSFTSNYESSYADGYEQNCEHNLFSDENRIFFKKSCYKDA